MLYKNLSKEELQQRLDSQKAQYDEMLTHNYKVDIARGKPCNEQLDIAMPMLDVFAGAEVAMPKDYRNYGMLDGIKEMKELFAKILGVGAENIIVGGNSSLNLMYDTIQRALQFGILGNDSWNKTGAKFLCPVPGYDRHFAILEHFGIEMINIPMDNNGPNMDLVEKLVANDDKIKGMWCVPKYSNPTGVTYSDEVVDRLAKMVTKAKDFRIFWDNAYCVHELTDTPDQLANIMTACKGYGNEDRVYQFTSTSKITFAGAGVGCIATSVANVKDILSHMTMQTIGFNKVNQYMHFLYLKNVENIAEIMKKQTAVIKPKFDAIINAFEENFGKDTDIATWTNPKGGYFITLNTMSGCAKRVGELCKKAGLTITEVGAAFPYGKDDEDKTLRIAPTFTSDADLEVAIKILICCVKIASIEKIYNNLSA